jgi:hypothetical protein
VALSDDGYESFQDRVVDALEGFADSMDDGSHTALRGIVPSWACGRFDEAGVARFARAALHLAAEIERGRWDSTLPRCSADELLLQHAIDTIEWVDEEEDLGLGDDIEAARDALFQDDDVLLLFAPGGEEQAMAFAAALPDNDFLEPSAWFEPFTECRDREDP